METTKPTLRASSTMMALCDTSSKGQEGRLLHEPDHEMASSPASGSQTLPPLLALPAELKLQIFSYLTDDDYPALPCLRRTHSSFLNLIPKARIRSSVSDETLYRQLVTTDMEYAYLLPPGHRPCFVCTEMLPFDAFDAKSEPYVRDDNDHGYRYIHCCKECSNTESFVDLLRAFQRPEAPPNTPIYYEGLEMKCR